MIAVCNYSVSIQLLNQLRNMKFVSNFHLKCPIGIAPPRSVYCSIYRIICTDQRLEAIGTVQCKSDLAVEQEGLHYHEPLLKEYLSILDNRYFKLVSESKDSNLEEMIKKEEFKDVLFKSPFSFDVDLSNNLKCDSLQVSRISLDSFEDICKSSFSDEIIKQSSESFIWCSKPVSNKNDPDKPTEQQLLYVIDRLTYSLLNFFEKPHNYSIYHKKIVFQNCIRGVTTKGLNAYIQAMYILKLYGRFHYAKVKVEILKITHHIEDGTVRVRWRVNGVSRHKLLFHIWKLKKLTLSQYVQDETEWIDGFSVFSVDADGLIYKHVCDKLTPDDNSVKVNKSDLKSKLLGLLDLSQRGPAGSLHTLSCFRNQEPPMYKRIT